MSSELDNAVGEAPARVDAVQLLNEKRQALDAARERYKIAKTARDEDAMSDEARRIDSLLAIIPELERDASVVLEARGKKEAEERLLGIKRAAGSVRSELTDDDKRIRELKNELTEVNAKRTTRARKYETLQGEANGLVDRFGLPPLKLETLAEPPAIEVPAPWRHHVVRPSFEQCEHNLRQRRDYTEIRASAAYAIIMKTGLKPFRPLTERESEVLEDRAEERKPDPVLAAAAIEANALGNLGVPGGGVARG